LPGGWPFWTLEKHPQPEQAQFIMVEVDLLISQAENADELIKPRHWSEIQLRVNRLVYTYFGLNADEVAMIEELATLAGPALQPASLRHGSLAKPLRVAPSDDMMEAYADKLAESLGEWRDATGGSGAISVATWTGRSVPLGLSLTYAPAKRRRPADRPLWKVPRLWAGWGLAEPLLVPTAARKPHAPGHMRASVRRREPRHLC